MAQPSYHGRFIWHELLSNDPQNLTGFYTRLFSWRANPMSPGSPYTVFSGGDGVPLAGAMRLSDEARAMGAKAQWLGYIGSGDVDGTVAKALGLGAWILKPAEDIATVGRAAVLIDPQGARFGVYRPAREPGGANAAAFDWNELATRERDSAFGFYRQLFGWTAKPPMDMGGGMMYQTFGLGGPDIGGIYTIQASSPMSPGWLPYMHHASADQAATAAVAAGGKLCNGPMDVPGGGRIVQLLDPQGVMFAVHSMPAMAAKPAATKPTAMPKPKPKAKAKAKPKAKPKAKAKAKARPKAKPKAKSRPKAKAKSRSRPKPKAKARKPARGRRPARKK